MTWRSNSSSNPQLNSANKKISLLGRLNMELLFAGSKSEGLYPVLHANDGRAYRAYVKGPIPLNKDMIHAYAGIDVCLRGVIDDLRGHWRITLDPTDPDMIHPLQVTHDEPGFAKVPAAVKVPGEALVNESVDTICARSEIELKPPNGGIEDKAPTVGSSDSVEDGQGGSSE
jgi:hypothetical protein